MMTQSAASTELGIYQAIVTKTAEMLEAANEKELTRLEKLSDERDQLILALQQPQSPPLTPATQDQKVNLITEILAQEHALQSTITAWRKHVSGLLRINRVQQTLSVAYTPESAPR